MYDFAIVGSGVSGGRIAFDLQKSGARCVLIEAGSDFSAQGFFDKEMEYSSQMFWGGGLEISTTGSLGFLRAKCLGGTSVVNQALLDPFDEMAWGDWKNRTGITFFSTNDMQTHYDACYSDLEVVEIPQEHQNSNAKKFIGAFNKLGFAWAPLHRAQGDCKINHGSDCIVCLGGCPRHSKQSTLVTSIKKAKALGLEVRTNFEVLKINVPPLSQSGSEITLLGLKDSRQVEVRCANVVLAAGALGNSKILLNSSLKGLSPALGKYFSCHPQFMTYALFNEKIDAHKGAFQSVEGKDTRFRKWGLKFENVYAPPIGTAMLIPGFGSKHLQKMKKYRYYASMEVALRDEPSGVISLQANRLSIQKSLTHSDWEKARQGISMVEEFFRAMGALEIIVCRQSFGLHLMGGCSIGSDPQTSVVCPDFHVHDYKNIFIADSSIFPSAPGINPSFTIMALSHRASQSILRSR